MHLRVARAFCREHEAAYRVDLELSPPRRSVAQNGSECSLVRAGCVAAGLCGVSRLPAQSSWVLESGEAEAGAKAEWPFQLRPSKPRGPKGQCFCLGLDRNPWLGKLGLVKHGKAGCLCSRLRLWTQSKVHAALPLQLAASVRVLAGPGRGLEFRFPQDQLGYY